MDVRLEAYGTQCGVIGSAPARLTWLTPVHSRSKIAIRVEGIGEVRGERVASGNGVRARLALDGAVAACCPYQLLDAPAGVTLDEPANGEGSDRDCHVWVDALAFVVEHRPRSASRAW